MSIANNVMNKTYMSGFAELVTAMSDPQRYGEGYFQRFAGSLVPAGVAMMARAMDPYALEADTMLERIRSRVPGLTKICRFAVIYGVSRLRIVLAWARSMTP